MKKIVSLLGPLFWWFIPYRPMLELKQGWRQKVREGHGTDEEIYTKMKAWVEQSLPYVPIVKRWKGEDFMWFKTQAHAAEFKFKWL